MTRHDLRTLTLLFAGLLCGSLTALGIHHF
jgi:hypothetical protein